MQGQASHFGNISTLRLTYGIIIIIILKPTNEQLSWKLRGKQCKKTTKQKAFSWVHCISKWKKVMRSAFSVFPRAGTRRDARAEKVGVRTTDPSLRRESFRSLKTCHTCLLSDMYRLTYMCLRTSADTCQTIDMCDMFNMCFQMRKLSKVESVYAPCLVNIVLSPNLVPRYNYCAWDWLALHTRLTVSWTSCCTSIFIHFQFSPVQGRPCRENWSAHLALVCRADKEA